MKLKKYSCFVFFTLSAVTSYCQSDSAKVFNALKGKWMYVVNQYTTTYMYIQENIILFSHSDIKPPTTDTVQYTVSKTSCNANKYISKGTGFYMKFSRKDVNNPDLYDCNLILQLNDKELTLIDLKRNFKKVVFKRIL